jgi:sortase A
MRIWNIIMNVLSLLLVGAGVALIATFFLGSAFLGAGATDESAGAAREDFDLPKLAENPVPSSQETGRAEDQLTKDGAQEPVPVEAPKNKTLRITIPAMARVQNAEIPYTTGTDEESLRNHTAVHLEGTGFPWEEEANVYIAGHRLGYPRSESFLAFYDLNVLEDGDEVYVTDASGKKYTYRVFKNFVADPTDVFVTEPIEGRNILTLQTCTLPDYSRRLIVQAEQVT